jgi:hypothetical protein
LFLFFNERSMKGMNYHSWLTKRSNKMIIDCHEKKRNLLSIVSLTNREGLSDHGVNLFRLNRLIVIINDRY